LEGSPDRPRERADHRGVCVELDGKLLAHGVSKALQGAGDMCAEGIWAQASPQTRSYHGAVRPCDAQIPWLGGIIDHDQLHLQRIFMLLQLAGEDIETRNVPSVRANGYEDGEH